MKRLDGAHPTVAGGGLAGQLVAAAVPVEPADAGGTADQLTAAERAILDFEAEWQRATSPAQLANKNNQIRKAFGFSPTRYYRRLLVLVERAAAAAYRPAVVRRVRDVRDLRRAARAA